MAFISALRALFFLRFPQRKRKGGNSGIKWDSGIRTALNFFANNVSNREVPERGQPLITIIIVFQKLYNLINFLIARSFLRPIVSEAEGSGYLHLGINVMIL